MTEKINMTPCLSVRDYSVVLITLTDAQLLDELETNQWLMGHEQNSVVDYKERYLACRSEIDTRSDKMST